MKKLNKLLIILISIVFMASGISAQEVLYDNGPFVTNVGAGSNSSDYSVVQTDLGLGATGQSVNINGPTEISLADDFVVDETWMINSFTFFAYQTGAGPPSTIIDVKVQIWDGNPMDGGSVIWGDISLATGPNLLVSTEWTNCWRVKTPYAENRPIMNIVANTAGLVLEPGTYWVQWTSAGSASSGPWAPYISILGQAETGNSIQKQSGWNPNMDGGFAQGIPFIIQGTTSNQGVLYDNGPFVTNVGAGSNSSDYSVVQTDLGLGATGQSVNINGPTEISLADDFVVDETWTINSFTFFGYQTGAGPPSTITECKVQIWDGNPMDGGSVIWGDISLATGPNLLVSTEWTNCWRVKTPYAENRPIMNIVANTAGLVLEPGTYWVQYTSAGSASSGPWAPYISILGQAETGNSIQKQSGWNPNMDGGFGQGIPFIIHGTTGGGLPANDLSLISISSPNTAMGLGDETVSVTVINMGTETQTGFDVSYTINGGAAVTETVSATLASFETYDYTFNTTADLSEIGIYNIEACVILTGDENT